MANEDELRNMVEAVVLAMRGIDEKVVEPKDEGSDEEYLCPDLKVEFVDKKQRKSALKSTRKATSFEVKVKKLVAEKNRVCANYGYEYEFVGTKGKLVLLRFVGEKYESKTPSVFCVSNRGKLVKNKLFEVNSRGRVVRA